MAIKRFLRLTYLACGCALLLACGGGSKKKASTGGDGGEPDANAPIITPSTDLKGVNDNISKLGDRATTIEKNVKDLQGGLDTANQSVSDLAKRVKSLETTPDPTSCSTSTNSATCIPDGLSLAQMGIDAIVKKVCEYEVNCCSAEELNFKFGPAVTNVDQCVQTFDGLVNNGLTPSFLTDNGYVVQNVVLLAQAFNNPDVRIEIDAKAVDACVAKLDGRECAKYTAPSTTPDQITHCTPTDVTSEANPCSLLQLINGLAVEGEPCGIVSPPSPGTTIPECADGLVCRAVNGPNIAARGICAKPTKAGDRCTSENECDRSEHLFCNFSTGTCQAMAALGEACAYVDPDFNKGGNPLSYAIECLPELGCDPTSKKCVAQCSDGWICNFINKGADCPDGMVCNLTEVPGLYQQPAPAPSYRLGVCRTATAKGDPCTDNSECASGHCAGSIASNKACGDPLKKPGDACDAAGADDTCDSTYCGTDMKCTERCKYDIDLEQYVPCAAGYFCNQAEPITVTSGPTEYACEPLIADTNPCGLNYTDVSNRHSTCTSGFCKPGTGNGTCSPKSTTTGANSCMTGLDQECPAGQYCNTASSNTCTANTAAGGTCTGPGDRQCGLGNFCDLVASAYKCVTPVTGEGGACTPSTNACKPPLQCASDNKCHGDGKYPDGVLCPTSSDDVCMSGWCSGDGATNAYTCKAPIADGEDCDTAFSTHVVDRTKNRCGPTSYCKNPPDASAGKCTPKGSVGQACEPRFQGQDCLNHNQPDSAGTCNLKNDAYTCDANATAVDQVMCHGT